MHTIAQYQEVFRVYLDTWFQIKEPKNLYEPVSYILSLGGKRMRPVLTLMGAEVFGKDYVEALPAAMAVEVFHNFSLVHDDIMDQAPLRRGNATVHEKWDINTAILSGDAMLILAYQYFENYSPLIFNRLARLFSKTALQVCEGQQWDVDFENMELVSMEEYLKMIEYKTAVLVGAALKMGAIVAEARETDADHIYDFGLNLGIAFQLQDDYLDAFGDPKSFGKQVGGDIIENKKTYLYIKALELADPVVKEQLLHLYSIVPEDNTDKIHSVKEIFVQTGAVDSIQRSIESYTRHAFTLLDKMLISDGKKELLRAFGDKLMKRIV